MAYTRNGKASVHLYIEEGLKSDAENIYYDLGLTLSDAVVIFLRQSIAKGGFPFEVTLTDEEREVLRRRANGSKNRKETRSANKANADQ